MWNFVIKLKCVLSFMNMSFSQCGSEVCVRLRLQEAEHLCVSSCCVEWFTPDADETLADRVISSDLSLTQRSFQYSREDCRISAVHSRCFLSRSLWLQIQIHLRFMTITSLCPLCTNYRHEQMMTSWCYRCDASLLGRSSQSLINSSRHITVEYKRPEMSRCFCLKRCWVVISVKVKHTHWSSQRYKQQQHTQTHTHTNCPQTNDAFYLSLSHTHTHKADPQLSTSESNHYCYTTWPQDHTHTHGAINRQQTWRQRVYTLFHL